MTVNKIQKEIDSLKDNIFVYPNINEQTKTYCNNIELACREFISVYRKKRDPKNEEKREQFNSFILSISVKYNVPYNNLYRIIWGFEK